jgi:hypothetical protein
LFPLFLWGKDPISSEADARDDLAAVSNPPETASLQLQCADGNQVHNFHQDPSLVI